MSSPTENLYVQGWSSPSNIALVKYWGKKGKQIPQNPSVSFTLSTCRTNTILISSPKHSDKPTRSFYFEEEEATAFGKKPKTYRNFYS